MASLVHSVGHGLVADDAFFFANLVPADAGPAEGTTYYVLAAGLTADDFEFSETVGGAPFALARDIDSGGVSKLAVYTPITDPADVMAPPVAPATPTGLAWSSTVVVQPDGTTSVRIDIAIDAATDPSTRSVVVILDRGSGNPVRVTLAPNQTTVSVENILGNVSYTLTAIAYDVFGNASAATAGVTHTTVKDTTAPATPTGLSAQDGVLGIAVLWTSNTETDLAYYELQVDDDSGFGSPSTFQLRGSLLQVTPLVPGTFYARVRAVDTSGNASAYSTSDSAEARLVATADIDPTAIINQATNLINGTATITIDDDGLHIEDGALFLKDEFGETVLVASGFSGTWSDFAALGLYNGRFRAGTVGTVANGRTAALPYWTVSDPDTSAETLTFLSGGGIKMTWGAIDKRKRVLSDLIPVIQGRDYELGVDITWHEAAGHVDCIVTVLWYEVDGTTLISSPALPTQVSDPLINDIHFRVAGGVQSPVGAYFARVQVDGKEVTTHSASNALSVYAAWLRDVPSQLSVVTMSDLTTGNITASGSVAINSSGSVDPELSVAGTLKADGLVRVGGSAFPGTPNTGDQFFRTDRGKWFFYDGTRWLSTQLFEAYANSWANSGTWAITLSVTTASVYRAIAYSSVGTDIFVEDVILMPFVNSGGTALGASHKWVATVNKVDTSNAATSLGTLSLASGSSNVWRPLVLSVGAALGSATGYSHIRIDWTKTGTPGDLNITAGFKFTYRIVST